MYAASRSLALFIGLGLTAALGAFPSPTRFDEDKSWTGKMVIMKRSGVRFFRTDPGGADVPAGTLSRIDYQVVKDQGDKIWVRHNAVDGWFPRSDAVVVAEAVDHFSKELAKNANDASLLARRSKAYELRGELDKAIEDYDTALVATPNNSSWLNNRANLYSKKRDYDKALEGYDAALQANPNTAIIWNNRGNAWFHKRDYDRALDDYCRSVELDPTYTLALVNRAGCWREKRELDKALRDLNAAIRLDPKLAAAFSQRGVVWAALTEHAKAAADFAEAIRLDPRSAVAFLNRGNYRKDRKELDRAIDDYTHALWLDPRQLNALCQRGNARRDQGEFDKALADFDATLKEDANHLHALIGKALLLASCPEPKFRDGATALALATKACELSATKMPGALAARAAACAELERFEEAVQYQKQALADPHYARECGDEGKKRLALYESGKPYRHE